jgi:hypothetical protein
MAVRIVALVLGLVIAAGVIVIALEARYQSCVAEAEAANPVYVSVEQQEDTSPFGQLSGRTEPGPISSRVRGRAERRRAVDDC